MNNVEMKSATEFESEYVKYLNMSPKHQNSTSELTSYLLFKGLCHRRSSSRNDSLSILCCLENILLISFMPFLLE